MKNFKANLKEYKFYTDLKVDNVHLWYNKETHNYIVTVMFTADFIKKINLNYQLIK